jgi:hypothetical protein
VGVAVGAAVGVIKKANEAIKETTDLYKIQATAEKQLEVAAKNNPYLNETSVVQLKAYASELQGISTVGDEQLIPMMAQLAAAGRTQAEIQDIMSAALDVSASGMMSLDAAVTALNKTYSGTTGQLGNQISAIKNLTKEELQSGKAVEIIAQQFKGMAKETAELTGTSEQLANAIGDYKELLGETFEGAFAPMRKWFTEVITKHNNAKKAAREHKKAVKEVYDENGEIKDDASESSLFTVWQNLKKETDEARQALIDYKKEQGFDSSNVELWDQYTIEETAKVQRLQKEANQAESAYRKVVKQRTEAEEKARKEAEAQEEIARQVAEENSRLERREKLRKEYSDSLEDVQKQIAARRALGEEISDPYNSEGGGNVSGMGLLSCRTVFSQDKKRSQTSGRFTEVGGVFSNLSHAEFKGYEIHLGETASDEKPLLDCGGAQKGNIYGCYIHGIFDEADIAERIVSKLYEQKGLSYNSGKKDRKAYKENQYNLLADEVRKNIDMKLVYEILERGLDA